MRYDLARRHAVVFGASGALGAHLLRALRREDAAVTAVVRSLPEDPLGGVAYVAADLGTPEGVLAACRTVAAQEPLEILLVAVGAYAAGRLEETSPQLFESLLWVNARLPHHILQGLLGALRSAGGRAVVVGALGGAEPRAGQGAYAASKAALHSIVQVAAKELKGSQATINALLPSTLDTKKNRSAMPAKDPADFVAPERLAEIALFLVSDAAQDVQGALIEVRGRA